MERRGFLKGMLLATSAAASTALIRLAEPGDVEALVAQRDVLLAQPQSSSMDAVMKAWHGGGEVYARLDGEFVPIGFIKEFRVSTPIDDVVQWDGTVTVVPGLKRAQLLFEGFAS
jgi:hypothetical protein